MVGLGAMGSAAVYHLARRGVSVVGIEQFGLGHDRGSSHGQSRVFRTTYDDDLYVALARESLALWRALESTTGCEVLELCGLLIHASESNQRFTRTLEVLAQTGLPHEVMDGPEASRRFPTFAFDSGTRAFFAEENGFLKADLALAQFRSSAVDHGATLIDNCRVDSIHPEIGGVRLSTSGGEVTAGHVVLTAGPWIGQLAKEMNWTLEVTRERKVYFQVHAPDRFHPDCFPAFCEYDTAYYGFPSLDGQTIKVAADHTGVPVSPDQVDRDVEDDYITMMSAWLDRWQPGVVQAPSSSAVCLYTNTPDHDFLIGVHPENERVLMAGGFSGHGFKFSVLVGDILSDLVIDGTTRRPIERFRVDRFV